MTDGEVIAAGFFRHGTDVLLVRGGDRSRHRWDAVSVRIKGSNGRDGNEGMSAPDRLSAAVGGSLEATLVRSGDEIDTEGGERRRRIQPYLFECANREVTLAGSVTAHEWVQPPAICDRETVAGLWDAYRAVAPSSRTVREDTEHGAGYVSLRALEVLRDRATGAVGSGGSYESIASVARRLNRARPSMGVVRTRIDRVMAEADRTPESVRDRAIEACTEAVRAERAAAERVVSRLGERVLTLSRSGTVDTALKAATPASVFVAESRPAREGVGVAEELSEAGIDVTVLVDAAMGQLVASGQIDTVLVGADSVLADGSVVNKIGTRTAMEAGRSAGIDRFVVCSRDKVVPETTFDPEPGPPDSVYAGDADIGVYNPTFERVPAREISAIVTEAGVYAPGDVEPIAEEHRSYREWDR